MGNGYSKGLREIDGWIEIEEEYAEYGEEKVKLKLGAEGVIERRHITKKVNKTRKREMIR